MLKISFVLHFYFSKPRAPALISSFERGFVWTGFSPMESLLVTTAFIHVSELRRHTCTRQTGNLEQKRDKTVYFRSIYIDVIIILN